MGTLKVDGNISATGTMSASSFLGNASTSSIPLGFSYRETSWTWGTLTAANGYTLLTDWITPATGGLAFADKGTQVSCQIDGYFYQDEGRYIVLDANNYTSYAPTKTGSGASGTWKINITGNAATASLLSIHNTVTNTSTRSVSASSWTGSVSGLKYVWGEAFKDTSLGSDTGDLVLGLRAGQYASGGTELCMMIDGDYYSMGNKVLHAGNYSSYALPISGGRIQGDLKVNTNSGTNGFFIERLGGGEYTKIYQDDQSLYFNMYNDETTCSIYFNMEASDIESGGGAGANSGAVSFHLRNGKTTVGANYFSGTAEYANSAGAVAWNNITGKPEAFMPLSNQNNYVRVYNSSNINGGSTKVSVNDLAKQGFAAAMINSVTDNPTKLTTSSSATWIHALSMAWGADSNASWISQLAMGVGQSDGFWYRTTKETCVGAAWKRVLDETNYSTYALPKSGGILTGNLTLSSSKHLQMIYNNTTYSVIHNHNNGNISIDATGKALYLGFKNTTGIYCRGSYVNLDSGNYTDYAATKSHDHGHGYAPMGNYTLANGSSVDVTLNANIGSCIISCQGTLGNAHSLFMYTGYGSGGTVRSRIIALDNSPNITAQVLNSNGFKITNNTGQNLKIGVVSLGECGWPTFTASSTAANYSGVQRLVNGTNIVYSAPSSSSYYGDVCFLVT